MENTNQTNERGILSPRRSLRMVFLLFFLCCSLAQAGAGQDHRHRSDQAERRTLSAHFKAIEKETGYAFIYSKEILPALSQEVTLDVSGQDIHKILPALFEDTPLTYEVNGKQVVVEKKKEFSTSPQKEKKGTTVSGVITDTQGVPVIGADVIENGTSNGTISDIDGRFTLEVKPGATLRISFMGFITQMVSVGDHNSLSVRLKEDSKGLEEAVVVGYGTQKKITVTGSIATVKGSELVKSPVPNLAASLTGRVSGVSTMQNSGEPGKDDVTIRVRGIGTLTENAAQPLVIVDGIERSFDQINADEVESISVLKDASATAVYGIRGANGVIIVTTKKGVDGPAKVSYNGNFSVQSPTRLPKFLKGYEFAKLYNEAAANDNPNSEPAFSDEELQKFKDGSDPLFYPSTDWLDLAMKKHAAQTRHTVNISSSTKRVSYFVSLGYLWQDGLFKEFQKASNISNNNTYGRFNFRSNISVEVTSTTKVNFQLGGYSGQRNSSRGMAEGSDNSFFRRLLQSPPNGTIGYYEGKIIKLDQAGGRYSGGRNALEALNDGYVDVQSNSLSINLGLEQKLDFLLRGLSFRAQLAYDNSYWRQRTFRRNAIAYSPVKSADGETVFRPLGDETDVVADPAMAYGRGRQFYVDWGLNYSRSFGDHHVGALLLYNQKKKWYHGQSYPGVPLGYQDMVGRVTYNYDYRYLLEFNIGRNGSENFPKNHRFGWFPAVSIGWIPTNESFVKRTLGSDILSYLKIRASYGEVGNDKFGSARFMYYPSEYLNGSGLSGYGILGEDPKLYYGFYEGKAGNPNVTWERSKKADIAIESRFLKDQLNLTFNYFHEKRNNILTKRNTIPSYISAVIQDTYNIGRVKNSGYEIEWGWKSDIRDFHYWINGNYSFARNEILFMDEILNEKYPNLNRTGHRVGEQYGYVFDGFFNTQEEIDAAPLYFDKKPSLGDTRYKDITGDGVIDVNDQQAIGYPRFPEIFYGISAGFSFRGFDFSVLFQGCANASIFLSDTFYKPFNSFGSALDIVEGRWHADSPDGNANATFPKLTVAYGTPQNYYNSTLNQKDASYIRLKNVEIGYSFTKARFKRLPIASARLFVNGQNLITWDKLKIIDPEGVAGRDLRYPQMTTMNIGCRVDF